MRLHSIKLSGFKSFADPTNLSFPAQVAGVVGPNGSGKSNIVDAIRWVLGERSARELRGGHISDVIFNGSSTRQASGLARIELHFENAYGKLKGDYARFNEITVAREVDSDSQSTYYINNVRARRRDIVDCFLGTGLGPRSYAIIQQGTISRLVEAKPDELRHHLEEVAGISLYRERRHETELRLKNTRDNLSRLLDTIEELDKHLRQLKRQAENAEKYRGLKTERDRLHNCLVVARWRALEKRISAFSNQAEGNRKKSEALTARLSSGEAEVARVNTSAEETQRRMDQQQRKFYELQKSIALSEQEIASIESRRQELADGLERAGQQRMRLNAQHASDRAGLDDLAGRISGLSETRAQQQRALGEKTRELTQVEKDYHRLQSDFQQSQHAVFELQKQLELLRYQINDNEQQLHQVEEKTSNLAQPDAQLADQLAQLDQAAKREQRSLDELTAYLQQSEQTLASKRKERDQLTRQRQGEEEELKRIERELRQGEGRMESLQTLIDSKTGHNGQKRGQKADPAKLGLSPMLKQLKVAQGWEAAVELACGEVIRGYLVPEDAGPKKIIQALKGSGLSLARGGKQQAHPPPSGLYALDAIVTGPTPGWMARIWFAEKIEDALKHWDGLDGHRIICKDGSVLAEDWATLGRPPEGETLVSLQQRLDETSHSLTKLGERHEQLETGLAELHAKHTALDGELEALEAGLRGKQQDAFNSRSRLERNEFQKKSLTQAEERRTRAHAEQSGQGKKLRSAIAGFKEQLTKTLERQEHTQQSHNEIRDRHSFTTERVQNLRAMVREQSEAAQKTELELGNAQTRRDYLTKSIETTDDTLTQLAERMERDQRQAEQLAAQPKTMREQLNARVTQLGEFDKELTGLRQQHSDFKHQAEQLTLGLRATRSQAEQQREALQKLEVDSTEARTRQQALIEQLVESDFDTAASQTPEEINLGETQEGFDQAERAIRNLGEVNHAAIKDYETESERRATLESQHREILRAIETLEAAIAKIDRETKSLFKDTFDRLNEQLKRIFPDMLGGGSAWLELTSNDLLESGVQIIARPPGKKNTTIAMLSGGEKAMTAISLVLALFSLNPAPFCVLDEVDAPLDDHNVVRFATTIQKISAQVQFVIITHSKITMEYMHSLLGVTMSEPGVSRIVSVDIESALKMVG